MTEVKEKSQDENEAVVQDGGYGWVVVAAAFTVGFLTDGLCFSFGVLLVELVEVFKASRAETAVIGSIVTGAMDFIGPFAGTMCERYGHRIIVSAGSLVSSVGFILSMFSTSLPHLYITYGILGGLGFGLMYLPANVCVIQHFNKRRTLANGINVCGSGVGTFVFNHLTYYLLDTYGWRGTLLVHAGILLNGIICGLLLLPPSKIKQNKEALSTSNIPNIGSGSASDEGDNEQYSKLNSETCEYKHDQSTGECSVLLGLDTDETQTSDVAAEAEIEVKGRKTDLQKTSTDKRDQLKSFCLQMFDIELLTNKRFICFLASLFIVNIAFVVPYHFLPDQAEELQIPKHLASWLVASIGLTNTVGRVIFGWLGDKPFVNRFVLFEVLVFGVGIVTCLSPLLRVVETKLLYSCVFGFLSGGYVTFITVVLADMFGAENISKSFGLILFAIGISSTFAGPLSGFFYDISGSYNTSFFIAGLEFILSGLIMILPWVCMRGRHKQTNE